MASVRNGEPVTGLKSCAADSFVGLAEKLNKILGGEEAKGHGASRKATG